MFTRITSDQIGSDEPIWSENALGLYQPKIEPINRTVSQFVLTESRLGKHKHIKPASWPIQP